ncbi:neuronal acetylcholine receptor subunit alpha-3-like [Pecten maximus]|uniref:neuronal acetylcholine receptor subunit alpha-3-like n=1 Tax=Pecten maximus TaxID=6579 RepID=UPI001458394B|nr:neuronal acetylcholine receptor subunit alpha-3-like [Pecten maximus]
MTNFRVLVSTVMFSVVIISCAHTQGTMDDLLRLKDVLFWNYTKDFRPVYNLSEPIHVTLDMLLISIVYLDEVTGIITVNCGLYTSWTDYNLVWNPSDFSGITSFVLNSSKVWKPRIYVTTSSEDLSDFSFDAYDVRVFSNGQVSSIPGRNVKASCSFDMTNFPSDSQTCVLQLTSLVYTLQELVLVRERPVINMVYYKPNGEWDLAWTSVRTNTVSGNLSSVLDFSIHLNRRSGFFIVSIAAPVFLLLFLNPFVFLLPTSSGERMSYSVTLSLSLAVYMTVVGEYMPKVSDPIPGICYFFLMAMLFSCFIILLTIFTLRCQDATDVNSFPSWILWMVKRVTHSTSCYKRKVTTLDLNADDGIIKDAKLTDHKNKVHVEQLKTNVQKEDVIRFIDRSLFCITLFYTVVTTLVFIFHYWY